MTADGKVAQQMREKLIAAFQPVYLDVVDESEAHRGHAGFQDGGESHFRVRIRAAAFAKMSRIERHRAIHKALGGTLISRIHALALEVSDQS